MEHSRNQELIRRLPLPLAVLLGRALNATSPAERHNNAYYLAEATLKLAAAARIGVWLERTFDRSSPVAQELERLVLPSIGHWCGLLRGVDDALAGRRDAALLPLGDVLGQIRTPLDAPAIAELARLAREAAVVNEDIARRAARGGIAGFFDMVAVYRNQVLGHGAQRDTRFSQRLSDAWLAALPEVLLSPLLLGGLRLAQLRVRTPSQTGVTRFWRGLTGPMPMPLTPEEEAEIGSEPAERAEPGHLYLVGPGTAIDLHPLLIAGVDELSQEAVGFLNKTVRRSRATADGHVEEIRRVDYLNYSTGAPLPDTDAERAVGELLARLRGRAVATNEMAIVRDQSRTTGEAELVLPVVAPGAEIGDFELLDELGRGGMAVVYRARQRSVNRMVALKVLPPSFAANPTTLARFTREIRALSVADHRNVVRIVTAGTAAGRPYFAMELVDGVDLARLGVVLRNWREAGVKLCEEHLPAAVEACLARPRASCDVEAMPPPTDTTSGRPIAQRLAELFAGAAEGLAHLHELRRPLVHRDVKPANLMLTRDARRLVLVDLGLVRPDTTERPLTANAGELLGTLRYMAPEQLKPGADRPDGRVDIYGLGASLYEILLGRRLFEEDSEAGLRQQVLFGRPTRPRAVQPTLPVVLAAVVERAIEKQPDLRYHEASALAEDLRAVAEGRPLMHARTGLLHRSWIHARRRPRLTAMLALLVVALCGAGLATWHNDRLKVRYCANFTYRWLVMACVGEVSAEDQRRRYRTFRFFERRGQVERVELINGSGALVKAGIQGQAVWEYHRRADGTLARSVVRDGWNEEVQHETFSEDLRREDKKDVEGNPHLMPDGHDVSTYFHTHDADGHCLETRFANHFGEPRPDSDNSFGVRWVYDERGLALRRSYVDVQGRPAANSQGIAHVRLAYSALGDLTDEWFLNGDEQPTGGQLGASHRALTLDDHGNVIEKRWYGVDGAPIEVDGIATTLITYDQRGNRTTESHLDAADRPVADERGVARTVYAHDAYGSPTRVSYFGVDGRSVHTPRSGAVLIRRYDARQREIEQRFLGPDGRPTTTVDGFAAVQHTWDAKGNPIRVRYLDPEDRPTLDCNGVAEGRRMFNARGQVTRETYLGVDGQPVLSPERIAGREMEYDRRGLLTRTVNLGLDLQPTVGTEGWAIHRIAHDEMGRPIENAYFDANERHTWHVGGFSRIEVRYDPKGRVLAITHFGPDGRPVFERHGVHRMTYLYDKHGYITGQDFYGPTGHRMTREGGHAAFRWQLDPWGRTVEGRFLGPDLQLEDGGSYAVTLHTFDRWGRETQVRYLDEHLQPANGRRGAPVVRMRYDTRGQRLAVDLLDANGEPQAGWQGWASSRAGFDARGRQIETRFIGLEGRSKVWHDTYDDRGNIVHRRLMDTDGAHQRDEHECSAIAITYDRRDRPTRKACLDAQGKPQADGEGVAYTQTDYGDEGRRVVRRFFGLDDWPTVRSGCAGEEEIFDTVGRRIERRCRGLAGQLVRVDGLHAEHLPELEVSAAIALTEYDAQGRPSTLRWSGVDGAPLARDQGVARALVSWNRWGDRTGVQIFGPDDRPVATSSTDAGWRDWLDGAGRPIRRVYFDVAERPTRGSFVDGKVGAVAAETMLWHIIDGRVHLSPDIPSEERPRLESIVRAHCAGFEAELLRADRPEVFRGASGLLVSAVEPDGRAARASLAPGDVLLTCDGHPILSAHQFGALIGSADASGRATLEVLRAEAVIEVETGRGPLGARLESMD